MATWRLDRRTGRILIATLILTGGLGGLAAWSGGFGARVGGTDLYGLYVPKHRYSAEVLSEGRLPLWNPYEANGVALLGWAQGSVLYPPVPLANAVLPPFPALQVLVQLHIAALVTLMLVYLTRAGVGIAAASVGVALAVGCLFRSIVIDHPLLLFALVYLPAMLLAWESLVAGHQSAATAFALCAGVQWLPGYPEVALDTAVVVGLAAFVGSNRATSRWTMTRRVGMAGALLAVGILVGAIQLGPLAEVVSESTRLDAADTFDLGRSLFAYASAGDQKTAAIASAPLVARILHRFGAGGVFCAVVGLLALGPDRRLWPLALAWSLFPTTFPFALLYNLPPYSLLRFAWAWEMIAALFMGCLAAAGVQRLWQRREDRHDWAPVVIGALLVPLALGFARADVAAGAGACAIAAAPPLRRRGAWLVPVAAVAVHVVSIMATIGTVHRWPAPDAPTLATRAVLLRNLRALLPDTPRIVSDQELRGGSFVTFHLPSPTTRESSTPPCRLSRLNDQLGLRAWHGDAASWKSLADQPRLAAMLGIGIVVVPPKQTGLLVAAGWKRVGAMPDGEEVLHRAAVPRFHVVYTVTPATDEEDAFRRIVDPTFDPWDEVVLEKPVPALDAEPQSTTRASVRVVTDLPEHIALEVTVPARGILLSSDAFMRGWTARVDDAGVALLRANYAFRAVVLEPGTHRVEFRYRPLGFEIGCVLSLLGLVVAVMIGGRTAGTHC